MAKSRILIVEDEIIVAKDLGKRLEELGYEVVGKVRSGEEAIEVVRQATPDLVLMDIVLDGDLDGIEAAGRIRDSFGTPVVYITSHSDDGLLQRAKFTEPYGYLLKPFEMRAIFASVEMALHRARVEQRLADSEHRFRHIYETAPAAICELDLSRVKREVEGLKTRGVHDIREYCAKNAEFLRDLLREVEILDVNDATLRMFDASDKDELLDSLDRLEVPDFMDLVREVVGRIADGGSSFEVETAAGSLTNDRIDVIVSVALPREPEDFKQVVLSIKDITGRKRMELALEEAYGELEERIRHRTQQLAWANEQLLQEVGDRKRAEEALRESEEKFRTIVNSAHDCMFIKDDSRRYRLVNPAMAELLGLPEDKILGQTDEMLFENESAVHMRRLDRRVLKGERIEEEHTRSIQGIPQTFLDTRAPLQDAEGGIVGIIGIARNITDRVQSTVLAVPADSEYSSQAMRATLAAASLVARNDSLVLLTGESGTGKDYLAQYIHNHSRRSGGPFFAINCAAVAQELAESELFGHEAGAFTGAGRRKRGLLELAEGGTLLLNEVGDLPRTVQAKLLTFLDTRAFTRVGGEKNISVDARLMAATNRDLEKEVSEGRFRKDLFYRLNVFSLKIPPLRERSEDIPLLVSRIMEELSKHVHMGTPPAVDSQVMDALRDYHWPGNVRELRNVLERAIMLSANGRIGVDALGLRGHEGEWFCKVPFPEDRSMKDVTNEVQSALVAEALRRCSGRKRQAARMLGISHDSIYRILKR